MWGSGGASSVYLAGIKDPMLYLVFYLVYDLFMSSSSTAQKEPAMVISVRVFDRPSNKLIKRHPIRSASVSGFTVTLWSDGQAYFFKDDEAGSYAMLNKDNYNVYQELKKAVTLYTFPQP